MPRIMPEARYSRPLRYGIVEGMDMRDSRARVVVSVTYLLGG